jgi:cytoskeletal protein CcmA (bactofilin family)
VRPGRSAGLKGKPVRNIILAACIVAAVVASPLARADTTYDEDTVQHTLGSNHFAAGGSVEITDPVPGSAFVAGGQVLIKAPIAGDVFASGGQVEVRGDVGKGLYAAGGSLIVSGAVRRNARIAGGSVEVTPGARLNGSVSMAGRSLTMAGAVAGDLHMAGHDATLTGTVAGDAEIFAERIEIGPQARIGGTLGYRGDHGPRIAPGAEISGGVERLASSHGLWSWHNGVHDTFRGRGSRTWFFGTLILGALLLLAAPGFMTEASGITRTQWPASIGIGCAILIGVPFAMLLLVITLIGIPVALLALALYVAVLMLGYVVGAVALGDLALLRLAPRYAGGAGWRVLALLGALLALGLVRQVPLFGALTVALVFLTGVGALVLRATGSGLASAAPPVAPAGAA